ncbi:MAG: Rieske 2Fe-2S domain-containing protein, partial [Phycisphaerales bacterium]
LTIVQYHGFGDLNPFLSLLVSNTNYLSLGAFPFEILGVIGLLVLIVMAATSHDFYLATLSARVWKALHMSVYGAYALLIGHVALGALQQERSPLIALVLVAGVAVTATLHILAGQRERGADAKAPAGAGEHLLDLGPAIDIPLNRAKVVTLAGRERVAVFRYSERGQYKLSAVSNVCAHQQGPLGEGKVEGGCITCPWHGYQYRPGDGCAPPPFHEKIATYRLTLRGDRVLLDPRPLPPGTAVAPAICATPERDHG